MTHDRRSFLRNAGLTTLAGVLGTGAASAAAEPLAAGAPLAPGVEPAGGKYDFDTLAPRVGFETTKWDEQNRRFGHVDVGMGIADMDFVTAPCITRALMDRIQRGDNWGYVTIPESHVQSIVGWNKRRYGLEIDPKTIVHSPAVHPAIIATLRAFTPPGSRVIMPCPSYSGFYSDLRVVGVKPADVPLKLAKDGRYAMDLEGIERAIAHDTHALILCNPQNPTGNVWSKEDLLALGEIALKHRVVVLSDEIHCDFVNAGSKYTPFASLPNEAVVRNSITFKSASKSFNLAGGKCAYFFSTNPEYLSRIKAWHREEISTFGMTAHRAAYTDGDAWLDQLKAYNDANLTFVADYITKNIPLIKMVKPQGTYLGWVDVSAVVEKVGARDAAAKANKDRDPSLTPITPSHIMEKWFAEHAKVQLNPGGGFGTGGEERMRMNCGTSRKMLTLALNNLETALKAV